MTPINMLEHGMKNMRKENSMALEMVVKQERRLCKVKEEHGYFHAWEQYSKPLAASVLA